MKSSAGLLIAAMGGGLAFLVNRAYATVNDSAVSDASILLAAAEMFQPGGKGAMKISQAGIVLIKRFEGFRAGVYDANPPANDWTIGYGHKLRPGEGYRTITKQEAERLLRDDLSMAEDRVNGSINIALEQQEFDALCSLAYNLTLKSWRLAAARINRGDGAENVFPLYVMAEGERLQGLVKRRAAELKFYETGIA